MNYISAAADRAPGVLPGDMVWVPGGSFLMGSEDFYPEERPVRRVEVDGFWMGSHPVTVAEFRAFVAATGYVTVAERPLDPLEYPDADLALLHPGSLVFQPVTRPVDLSDPNRWWRYVPGADWRHPRGPGSGLDGLDRHPVTHVAAADADAYASWAGQDLATEAEWEFAARGGLCGAVFTWGDEETPHGQVMANTWQGEFPWRNLKPRRRPGTSPVQSFPPNGFGLYDMAGNVWEWTSDYFVNRPAGAAQAGCCAPRNPRVTSAADSLVPGQPGAHIPRRVIKGGSHLCAPNYCLRYRPAARQGEAVDTSTTHLGFRCIRRDAAAGPGRRPVTTHSYKVRVIGLLGPAAREAFADMAVAVEPTTTVLSADLDQAGLHALLDRVRALGLELVDVKQGPPP